MARKRGKVVLTVPGAFKLTERQVNTLKKNFKSQLVHSLGKARAGKITVSIIFVN